MVINNLHQIVSICVLPSQPSVCWSYVEPNKGLLWGLLFKHNGFWETWNNKEIYDKQYFINNDYLIGDNNEVLVKPMVRISFSNYKENRDISFNTIEEAQKFADSVFQQMRDAGIKLLNDPRKQQLNG